MTNPADGRAGGHPRHVHAAGGHSHVGRDADARLLRVALALIVGFLLVEVVVAVLSGSLALLADAGHMLTDAGAVGASLWAVRLAARPAAGRWTFGFTRAEILSAAGNGITLLVVGVLVGAEAIRRLVHAPPVHGGPVLAVALVGMVVNVVAVRVLGAANRDSMNVRGAFQHILTDLYGFAGTAVAGLVIVLTGWRQADPLASLVVVALMLRAAVGLLRDSGQVLLEAAPDTVDLDQVTAHLLGTPHVLGLHDLHVWTVTSDLRALSAHVVIEDSCFLDGHAPQILDRVQACLGGHFDVDHSTFQLEPLSHAGHEVGSHP